MLLEIMGPRTAYYASVINTGAIDTVSSQFFLESRGPVHMKDLLTP